MHWAAQRWSRTVFGVASFVPLLAIIALTEWSMRSPVVDRLLSLNLAAFKAAPTSTLIPFCVLFGVVIVFQIGLSALVVFHTEKRPDMSTANKAVWIVCCMLAGSIALPLFYFRKLRRWKP